MSRDYDRNKSKIAKLERKLKEVKNKYISKMEKLDSLKAKINKNTQILNKKEIEQLEKYKNHLGEIKKNYQKRRTQKN